MICSTFRINSGAEKTFIKTAVAAWRTSGEIFDFAPESIKTCVWDETPLITCNAAAPDISGAS